MAQFPLERERERERKNVYIHWSTLLRITLWKLHEITWVSTCEK